MIIQRAAAVRGGIGDSSSCMEIDFFLRNIRFRTHTYNHNIRSREHQIKNHNKLTVTGEVRPYVQPDQNKIVFLTTALSKLTLP